MAAEKDIIDRSAVAADTKFTSVFILFEDGVQKNADLYDEDIDRFAREFIRQGVKVFVSSTQVELEDRVRSLLAGAEKMDLPFETIFQVGAFEWDKTPADTRFFSLNKPGEDFTEVLRPQLEKKPPFMEKFESPTLYAQGRLISVRNQNGGSVNAQQIASIDMALPMNFTLPCNYVAEYEFTQRAGKGEFSEYKVKDENFPYKNADWRAKAMTETEDRMIAAIVARLLSK